MAKNEKDRIKYAIDGILESGFEDFELIVIDDHSEDDTYNIVKSYAAVDKRIKLYKNKYIGKVEGTNYGYELSSGDLVKCIDADDILDSQFFDCLQDIMPGCSHCHAANIVSNNLDYIAKYNVNHGIVDLNFEEVTSRLVSLPKWCWTFSREVADKIFPLPSDMPIEDIWMSIRAKQYSEKILVTDKPLYLYRQHKGQDYGGILNYGFDVVELRAWRSIKTIQLLELMNEYSYIDFSYLKNYLNLCVSRASLKAILFSDLVLRDKAKLVLILHFPSAASVFTKIKWWFDGRCQ
nr:glycosyltransferase family 2 protein [Halomonas sp. Mc5H-6]